VVASGRIQEWVAGGWQPVALRSGDEGWDPAQVTALAYDATRRLWVGTSQGMAVRQVGGAWHFIDPVL